MTIKEFSHKYGVPYHIVYEATYKVPAISTMRMDREFPEDGLYKEVERVISSRMEKHRKLYHKAQKQFISLQTVKKLEGFCNEMP